ncbi:MAG: hypothetical protein A3C35_01480 [Omnitrophica bacterium RIFCSPHIGHO2_02_FULL_46_11]|nr:MAG: hypothetical protein A3A81_02345 [Omnitrophica bacterium RIFCSPLOWO2_01_FULL_45_10b]OGW87609.1 MAG: hypothetical protein A3C35_01480 [Omnitrophica bacterium RIFCSPHIGHO2_02_FULL_46_11]
MKFILSVLFLALLMLSLNSQFAFAQEPSATQIENIQKKLAQLEAKVKIVKTVQEAIDQKQTIIDEELANLKIWIRRNRGG